MDGRHREKDLATAKRRPELIVQPPDFSNTLLRINVHGSHSVVSVGLFQRSPMETGLRIIAAGFTVRKIALGGGAMRGAARCSH